MFNFAKNERMVFRLSRALLAVACSFSLFACKSTNIGAASQSASTGVPGAPTSTPGKSVLPIFNPPNPGPYGTKLMDGVEMKVVRYPSGKFGGTFVRSIVATDPKVFNPWIASDSVSSELSGLMFSGVLTQDSYDGKVIPDMAESFEVMPDGVTYITKLRKGLKWSDGKPITADDVTFTWNRIIAGGYGNSSLRDVSSIDGKMPVVTTVDPLTNKYVTAKPFAPFLRLLGVSIAPKHIIEPIINKPDGRKAFDGLWSATTDPKSLVTDGPFVLKRFVPSQRVEFDAAKNYYAVNKEGKRLPYLEHLTYVLVPEANTNLLKFHAKEIDNIGARPRDVPDLLPKQTAENFTLYNLGPSNGTTFLMLNMNQRKNPKGQPYVDPKKSKWFNDVNFRQAINHTINRDHIVAGYFKGIGSPLFTAEPSASIFHNANLQPFKPDTDYAMSLLSKSGFTKHPDGFLYDQDGNKVEFTLLTMSGSAFCETAGNYIVEDLKKLGMKVNFQPIAFNVLNDKTSNSLDWEAVLMALTGSPLEPNDGGNVWKSSGRLHLFDQRSPDSVGTINVSDARPWEARLDELFREGALTLDDKKRHAIYDEYQKIIYDQVPVILLVTPMDLVAQRNNFHNFQPTPLSQLIDGLHNIEEIWKN